jgi:hypothetical protein
MAPSGSGQAMHSADSLGQFFLFQCGLFETMLIFLLPPRIGRSFVTVRSRMENDIDLSCAPRDSTMNTACVTSSARWGRLSGAAQTNKPDRRGAASISNAASDVHAHILSGAKSSFI